MSQTIAGIDVGGTFTDVIICDSAKGGTRISIAKTPTTRANQADGVLAAIAGAGSTPSDLDLIIHGTTTTTNAILERKIARCGLVTTRGFRDVLELGRRTRPQAYGMTGQFEPLIERPMRLEVDERMDARGNVRTSLDEDQVREAVRQLLDMGAESLVIHFLHSYANPAHELRAAAIARDLWPNNYITVGHTLLSEYREYERGTTASVNAAVQPVLDRYVANLQERLSHQGYARDLLVMTGNGGTSAASVVAAEAARTVMSGPASGVIAAAATATACGFDNIVTYDMGGTSTDVALVRGGRAEISSELSIDYGLPIHVPMVDVRTIGAGGGSIGYVDAAGLLKVGPESAGADPGPVAYGHGGTRPTISDANIILGRLTLDTFAARASKPVTMDDVRAAMQLHVAAPLGIGIEEAAAAMIHVANIQMAGAIRMVSLSRGHDPRDFALFAFGGAGPLHAAALARELAIPQVIVPARPGLVNALGCLVADLRQDVVNTLNRPLDDADMDEVHEILASQRQRGMDANNQAASDMVDTIVEHSADMQFRGQTHLIRVALPSPAPSREELQSLFEAAYYERFQIHLPEIRAMLVNLNTVVIGKRKPIPLAALLDAAQQAETVEQAQCGSRQVYFAGDAVATPVYRREALPLGVTLHGPAVIEQFDSTTLLDPDCTARVDAHGNLLINVQMQGQAT